MEKKRDVQRKMLTWEQWVAQSKICSAECSVSGRNGQAYKPLPDFVTGYRLSWEACHIGEGGSSL